MSILRSVSDNDDLPFISLVHVTILTDDVGMLSPIVLKQDCQLAAAQVEGMHTPFRGVIMILSLMNK